MRSERDLQHLRPRMDGSQALGPDDAVPVWMIRCLIELGWLPISTQKGTAGSIPQGTCSIDASHLGPVQPGLLGVMACDALIERVLLAPNGAVLDLGRTVRTITPPQRRALTARDRGCVIPGCTAPAEWRHGRHLVWWEHLGPTNKNNLALACTRHHARIHAGIWDLTMIDGIPWARRPSWVDPQRR